MLASFHCTGTLPKEKDLLNSRARGLDNYSEQALRIRAGILSPPVALVTSRFCRILFTSLAVVFMLNGSMDQWKTFFRKLGRNRLYKKND